MSDLAFLTQRPIAHRALHDVGAGIIENSPSAFRAAVEGGYAIECDVQISADGVAMVFHDASLTRLTGREGAVADLTAAELGNIPLLGSQDTIQPLADHLRIVDGKVPLIVELKKEPEGSDRLVNAVADALTGYHGPVAVMSFQHRQCAAFASAMPDIPRGLTAEGDASTRDIHARAMADYDMQFVSYAIKDMPTPFVAEQREAGAPIITWTVRTPEDAAKSARYADQITFEGFTP